MGLVRGEIQEQAPVMPALSHLDQFVLRYFHAALHGQGELSANCRSGSTASRKALRRPSFCFESSRRCSHRQRPNSSRCFRSSPSRPETAARLWKKSEPEACNILEALASRGTMLDIDSRHGQMFVVPPMADFFGFSMMRIGDHYDQKLLAELRLL